MATESLYVALFSNGTIKVGHSIDPTSRIASHADRVACVGLELVSSYQTECPDSAGMRERWLIATCAGKATARYQYEWFDGLDFETVTKWADDAARCEFFTRWVSDSMVALEEALRLADGFGALAKRIGVAASAPSMWRKRCVVPAEQAPGIERAVGGKVTAERLCPSAKFVRVPDANWPHPGGRPLLDTARCSQSQEA